MVAPHHIKARGRSAWARRRGGRPPARAIRDTHIPRSLCQKRRGLLSSWRVRDPHRPSRYFLMHSLAWAPRFGRLHRIGPKCAVITPKVARWRVLN